MPPLTPFLLLSVVLGATALVVVVGAWALTLRCSRRHAALQGELDESRTQRQREREAAQRDYSDLERDYAVLHTRFEEASRQHSEQLRLLEETKGALASQFENLANRIFEEQHKRFDTAREQQLQLLLKPFREQIEHFAEQSRRQYVEESRERHLLKDEIARLKQLNERISEDALNLTNALKGESKTQGNWGEIILERVLEASGLREGHEYETQGSYKDEKGRLQRPDVVVFLPKKRAVVIDAKVSLVAFERFMNAQEPEEKVRALKAHLASVNAHINGLSAKAYEKLPGVNTLDYVLMFMPIEGAFHLALEHDSGFFKQAYERGIMIVGPSTLLITLRTIENLWRSERQEENAREIARHAEHLYDKFVLFVEDMQRIGEQLGRTQESWEKAMNKLSSGKGNLIRRAEQMRALGLSPKKALPDAEE